MLTSDKRMRLNGIKPETIVAILVATLILDELHIQAEVRSVTDGAHSEKSLHYVGYAVDIAPLHPVPLNMAHTITNQLAHALSVEYDVLTETDSTGHFTHWHIEFQPKLSTKKPYEPSKG